MEPRSLPIIDLHQDLLAHMRFPEMSPGGVVQTSFELLERVPVKVLVTTAFPVPPQENFLDPAVPDMIEEDFKIYAEYANEHPNWMIVTNRTSLKSIIEGSDKHGIIMHIEGLNVLDDEPWPRLERWHALGWRSLGIVWNINNPLGGGTTDPTRGLTDLGREVLVWAESKRMLIDFAHMNPLVFADALAATKSPIFISHGNTNQHCPSPRNYSDQQLRAVADRGGVIGPFFSKDFLVPEGQPATLEDVAAHFLHLRNLVGSDHIALGTDFGGILYGFADSLSSLQDLPNLWQALREVGFSDAELEGIAWKNAARFFESVLP